MPSTMNETAKPSTDFPRLHLFLTFPPFLDFFSILSHYPDCLVSMNSVIHCRGSKPI